MQGAILSHQLVQSTLSSSCEGQDSFLRLPMRISLLPTKMLVLRKNSAVVQHHMQKFHVETLKAAWANLALNPSTTAYDSNTTSMQRGVVWHIHTHQLFPILSRRLCAQESPQPLDFLAVDLVAMLPTLYLRHRL